MNSPTTSTAAADEAALRGLFQQMLDTNTNSPLRKKEKKMMKLIPLIGATIVRIPVLSVAIFLMPVLTLAQDAKPTTTNPPSSHVIVRPDQLVWKPLIPGVEMAVVFGDLDKKGGLYVIRIRSKAEAKVPPHWHVTDEHVTVLEGSFWIAQGEQFDVSKLKELKPGAHFMMPAGHRHFGLHKAGNVIEVFGEAPWVVNFVNPEDDPRRAKTK